MILAGIDDIEGLARRSGTCSATSWSYTAAVHVQTSAEVHYKQRIQHEDFESQEVLIRVLVPRTLIRTVQRLVLSSICLLVTTLDRGPFALGAV